MTVDTLLATAWDDHGDRPHEVADRLAGSLWMVESPEQIPPFARLLTHVLGEHLGQWQRGIGLLEALRDLPAFDGGAVDGVITRAVATLRYASGDAAALMSLSLQDRVAALAGAAAALAGRSEFKSALAAYSEAVQLASTGLPPGSSAVRSLAVGGNNLALALEQKEDRDSSEALGMITAATASLKYWKQAGTWVEEERAEYRLTRSLLRAGKSEDAIQSARRCIDVCESNNATVFEQFFGYAVLALSQRAAGDFGAFEASRRLALALFERIPDDKRKWCESELKELGAI